jgi:hypothetical protein
VVDTDNSLSVPKRDLKTEREVTVYLQAVPGENLHAKPLGIKTWRKPGQINGNYTCRKEKEEKRREK